MTEALTLAQRLRKPLDPYTTMAVRDEAADMLEALTAEVEMLREVKHSSHWKARAEEAERLLAVQIAGHRLSAKEGTANLMRATAAEAKLAEALKERDRYKNGLHTLATTFYKDDQHQDYARSFLASKEASHAE